MTSRACRALLALALSLAAAGVIPGGVRAAEAPGAAEPARPAPAAAPAAAQPVAIGIGLVDPQIPDFADTAKTMTFSGQVQNTKTTPLKNVTLEMRRSYLSTRAELETPNSGTAYIVQVKPVPAKYSELAPGAAADWKFSLTEQELFNTKKPYHGVYAIDIVARDSDGTLLGSKRTFVVWKPVTDSKKTRVALLWPMVGQPGLTGQKTANEVAAPIVSDPQAAAQYKPDGRLSAILRDGQGFPVNWILDPDVLYTADQLSNGYFVAPSAASPKPQGGDGAQAAKDWLTAARQVFTAPTTQNCWNLPYADPDLTTLTHSQPGQALLAESLQLHAPATIGACRQPGTIAWPAAGQADATTLKGMQAANLPGQITLLSSAAVTAWKSAHVALPQSPNTVVYDTTLSNLFAGQAAPAGQPQLDGAGVLAGQLWLAETAVLAGESSNPIVVVAPPRDFTPQPALVQAVSAAETQAPADRWVGLEDLGKVLSSPAVAPPASPLTAKTDTPNLASDVVTSASDGQQLYSALHSIMDPSHQRDDAVPFRPVATWWRGRDGNAAFSKTVYSTVVAEHGLVTITDQSATLTLSGKSGTVPVTISNKTNATVHVYVRVRSTQSVQLKVDENQGQQTVGPGQAATVSIHVQGEGNGQTIGLVVTLYTCGDISSSCPYYPTDLFTKFKQNKGTITIPVKVSRIGIIALGLMIGSGVLLVALIGLRVYRAKRAQHASVQDTMAS